MYLSNHGKILNQVITEKGMSKAEFARTIGISRQLLNLWIKKNALSLNNLQLLNNKADIDPMRFLNANVDSK